MTYVQSFDKSNIVKVPQLCVLFQARQNFPVQESKFDQQRAVLIFSAVLACVDDSKYVYALLELSPSHEIARYLAEVEQQGQRRGNEA